MSAYNKGMSVYEKMECGVQTPNCIICLDGATAGDLISGKWLLMTTECDCNYKVHRHCVNSWLWYGLKGEPSCLMCGSKAQVRSYCEDVLYSRYVMCALSLVLIGVVLTGSFAIVFVVMAAIDENAS